MLNRKEKKNTKLNFKTHTYFLIPTIYTLNLSPKTSFVFLLYKVSPIYSSHSYGL